VITEDAQFIQPKDCNYEFTFEKGKKYFINIGPSASRATATPAPATPSITATRSLAPAGV
jgi:hypothetical protein